MVLPRTGLVLYWIHPLPSTTAGEFVVSTTTPKFGPLNDHLAVMVIRVIAMVAQEHLVTLDRLDSQVPATAERPIAARWVQLQRELYAPVSPIPFPPLPPQGWEIAAMISGASDSERITILQILTEVSAWLVVAATECVGRIEALPASQRPQGWEGVLSAVFAAAESLQVAWPSVMHGARSTVLTAALAALID